MMWRVTDANSSDGSTNSQQEERAVLANLPRARPQRTTQRRAAARNSARRSDAGGGAPPNRNGRSAAPAQTPDSPAGQAAAETRAPGRAGSGKQRESAREHPRGSSPGRASTRRRTSAPKRGAAPLDPAPRQGFECEGDAASGAVHPPGAAELIASAAEIVGDLAKAGLSTGERLIKDVFSRLPLS
jgi:hypothetical protein